VSEIDRPLLSIGAVARQLALPPATIRTWEMRYGIVIPQRTAGGQRLYSRAQLEQLRYLKRRVDEGSRPADAHRLLAERDGADDGADLRELLTRRGIAVEPNVELELVEPGRERPGSAVAVVARRA
jgi:DNA-binding transcriptional MerR regulator